MEAYIKSLYDRQEPDNQTKLFVLVQGAIDEMHNNAVVAGITDPVFYEKLHDPNSEIRIWKKTLLAKETGRKFIRNTVISHDERSMDYTVEVYCDSKFRKSITLAIQDIIEKVYLSGISKEISVTFHIQKKGRESVFKEFDKLIAVLDNFYEEITIIAENTNEINV